MFITQIYFSLRAKLEFKKFELKIGKFFQNQKEKVRFEQRFREID